MVSWFHELCVVVEGLTSRRQKESKSTNQGHREVKDIGPVTDYYFYKHHGQVTPSHCKYIKGLTG